MDTSRSPASKFRNADVVPIVAGYAGLLAVWDFQARPTLFLLLVVGTFAALFRFARAGAEIRLRSLLVVAVLARALLLPVPLSLSDDLYRYLWDGRVTVAGFDPYRLAPDDPALAPLRDELWEHAAHRDVETVYPPLAIALFAAAASLPFEVSAWKAMVALLDLGSCWLLWRLARRAGVPTRRVVWYAWNPLVVVETAGMGHVDAAGLFALVAGLYLLQPRLGGDRQELPRSRPALAGVLVAAGVLIKLVPAVLLPLLAVRSRSLRFAAAASILLVVGLLPMIAPSGGAPPGLVRYGVSWEFNGAVFEPLWRAIDRADVVPDVKATLDTVKTRLARPQSVDGLYHYVYPQLLAKLVLLVGLGWVVVAGLGLRSPWDATRFTLAGALLLSATGYPWYFLWILPWAALAASPAWLMLSLSLHGAYLPRLFGWSEWPVAFAVVWAPFLLVALIQWRSRAVGSGGAR